MEEKRKVAFMEDMSRSRMDGSIHLSIIQWLLHQQGMILSKLTLLQGQRRGRKQYGQWIEAVRRERMTGYLTKGTVICEGVHNMNWFTKYANAYTQKRKGFTKKRQMIELWRQGIGSSCLVLFIDRVKAMNNTFIEPAGQ